MISQWLRSKINPRSLASGVQHSGFHLNPELASKDEGAPREGRASGAVGGIAPIVTTSRHKPFSEFKIFIFSGVTADLGLR